MTSSSDSDFPLLRRRLFVHGIPPRTSPGELKAFFAAFGPVTGVHNSLKGYAFITFEEEEGATHAVRANGTQFQGRTIHVEFAHAHNHPPPPLIGARRLINFPKPFGARGGSNTARTPLSPGSSNAASTSLARWRPTHVMTTGAARGSRNGRARGGAVQRHQRSARQQLFSNNVRVMHSQYLEERLLNKEKDEEMYMEEKVAEEYRKLFSFKSYPHIAKKCFMYLDSVTLTRCKLVCRDWNSNIKKFVQDSPRMRSLMMDRWMSVECSFYPVNPFMYEVSAASVNFVEDNPDSSYRNVLCLKCDELEIILAVDNGNVEVYDRHSLRLKTILVGQFSSSPSSLDFNKNIILVSYTCGFGRIGRRFASCWNIYDRTSKLLLHSLERDGDEAIRIGFDDALMLTSQSAIFHVFDYSVPDHVRMKKIFATHEADTIEAIDVDHAHGFVAGVVRHDEEKRLMMHLWRRPAQEFILEEESADFMTHLVNMFPLLDEYAEKNSSFLPTKCKCLSVQLRYPRCLCFFSNAYGYFEYFEDRGRPYSLIGLYDLVMETCLRTITIDHTWMIKHNIVSYDYDSGILSAKFNDDRLVLGFGSYSDRKDGGIAMWTMDEILNAEMQEEDLTVSTLPAPSYHWMGWDGHTGGVHAMHLDKYQLVAANACVHQVTTRCIEGGDESKKDNVVVYDFWQPGRDERRRWSGGGGREDMPRVVMNND